MVNFNSREYKWVDLTIFYKGILVTKARGLTYKESQEKEALYAHGDEPLDIVSGNKAYEGTLDILQSGVFAMEAISETGSLLDEEFEIQSAYVPLKGGQVPIVETLKYCQFSEVEKGLKQGDKFKEVSLPFLFLKIEK